MNKNLITLLFCTLFLIYGCGSTNNIKLEQQRAEATRVEKTLTAERDAKRQECFDKLDEEFYAKVKLGQMPYKNSGGVDVNAKVTSMFGERINETIKDARLISITGKTAIVDVYWSYMDVAANRAPLGTNRLQAAMNAGLGGTEDKNVRIPVSSLLPPKKDRVYYHNCSRI